MSNHASKLSVSMPAPSYKGKFASREELDDFFANVYWDLTRTYPEDEPDIIGMEMITGVDLDIGCFYESQCNSDNPLTGCSTLGMIFCPLEEDDDNECVAISEIFGVARVCASVEQAQEWIDYTARAYDGGLFSGKSNADLCAMEALFCLAHGCKFGRLVPNAYESARRKYEEVMKKERAL